MCKLINALLSAYICTCPVQWKRIIVNYGHMMRLIIGRFRESCHMCAYIMTIPPVHDTHCGMKTLSDSKKSSLLASGILNPDPEAVKAKVFQWSQFFDPLDRAQVKYEMLRSHSVDDATVTEASKEFGFSRESFYQIHQAFEERGFTSLLPGKRGRKGPTKIKGEILQFVLEKHRQDPAIDPGRMSSLVAERYGTQVHRTTVMRAMKKKPHTRD
jgi:transposase